MAEAARQEKARKAAQQKPPAHVYTNEDLQRSQILTPEDRAPIEARKKNVTPPPEDENSPAIAPSQDTQQATSSESLGEIARRLRAEKAARQAEQARKLPQPAPFKLDLPHDAVLAHPKPPARPLVAPSTVPSSSPRIVKPRRETRSFFSRYNFCRTAQRNAGARAEICCTASSCPADSWRCPGSGSAHRGPARHDSTISC
jgi:hypothetical protein